MESVLKSKKTIWLILAVGLLFRLISLNQSLWLDEATTALVSKMSFSDIFSKFLPGDFHPPFYYLLMKLWVLVFGTSEISLRVPSVIFGIGIIYFVYLITKKIFSEKTANIASLLAATSGLLIYYSQEARMYSLTAFLAAAAFYLFIEEKWLWFSVIILFLGQTDYVALLIIPVFFIHHNKSIKKLILSLIPLISGFILWSPTFIKQIIGGLGNSGNSWWNILGTLTLKNAALIPIKFILGRISFDNTTIYGLIVAGTVFIFFLLIGSTIKDILRRPSKEQPCKVVVTWLFVPLILGTLISIKIPILYYFRFLFCLPAFYLLSANGLSKLKGGVFWSFFLFVISINIISSGIYLFDYKFHKEDWRAASQKIGNEILVMPGNSHEEAMIYYGKEANLTDIRNLTGKEGKIWLSRYVWEITDPGDTTRQKVESLGFTKMKEYNFNGVVLWEYTKNLYAYIN